MSIPYIAEGGMLADDEFLRRVATYYYTEGKTQEAIAALLYCSRQTIGKALQKAEDRGIIHIAVEPEERTGSLSTLSRDLRFTLGLEDLLLVPGRDFITDPSGNVIDDIMMDITAAAASYLDQILTDHDILAVTGGRNIMRNVVRCLKPSKILSNLQVVPITGFVEPSLSGEDANIVASAIANVYEARYAWLPIPAIVETLEQQEQARALPLARDVFKLMKQATIIMMGIRGANIDHDVIKRRVLSQRQLEILQAYRPVADIEHWVFDAQGRCINEIAETPPYYLTGLEIPHLQKRIRQRQTKGILVAGASKLCIPAVRAALNAGIVTILITDHVTAFALKDAMEK
jgi:deoxyribonucleoside regulator